MPIIQGYILEGSTIHTDGWKAYDGVVLNGYTHHRVFHSHDEFVRGKSHVNGIEKFGIMKKEDWLNSTDYPIKISFFTSKNANLDLIIEIPIFLC